MDDDDAEPKFANGPEPDGAYRHGPGERAAPTGGPDGADESDGAPDGSEVGVSNPAKLIRMGTMISQLLSEVREAPPDAEGLRRLATIHSRTLQELSGVLSDELFDELMEFNDCCDPATTPSESEIRVAQAQLVGWLQGLLQGMQASAATQALVAHSQLAEVRETGGAGGPGGAPTGGGPAGYL